MLLEDLCSLESFSMSREDLLRIEDPLPIEEFVLTVDDLTPIDDPRGTFPEDFPVCCFLEDESGDIPYLHTLPLKDFYPDPDEEDEEDVEGVEWFTDNVILFSTRIELF